MKDEKWLKDEVTRMNRGLGKISKELKHSMHDLEFAVLNGDLEEAINIVYKRKNLRISLQSALDRRKLLKRILYPIEEDKRWKPTGSNHAVHT